MILPWRSSILCSFQPLSDWPMMSKEQTGCPVPSIMSLLGHTLRLSLGMVCFFSLFLQKITNNLKYLISFLKCHSYFNESQDIWWKWLQPLMYNKHGFTTVTKLSYLKIHYYLKYKAWTFSGVQMSCGYWKYDVELTFQCTSCTQVTVVMLVFGA